MGALARAYRAGKYKKFYNKVDMYLLHFSKPVGHAWHYLGVVTESTIDERVTMHRKGHGAKLTRAAVLQGPELVLARIWEQVPRYFEVKYKNGSLRPVCPICNPKLGGSK